MELSSTERMIIQSGQKYFNAFGFEINDFGARALSISAIPAFLKNGSVEETIRDIIKYLMDGKNPDSFSQPEKTFCCCLCLWCSHKGRTEIITGRDECVTEQPFLRQKSIYLSSWQTDRCQDIGR
jgi:DNA mismatch repair ATPase MutL